MGQECLLSPNSSHPCLIESSSQVVTRLSQQRRQRAVRSQLILHLLWNGIQDAFALKYVDRGPDGHGLELPSAEAAALNEAKRATAS